MAKKVYEETRIAAIAEKIREMSGAETLYSTSTMPDGIEEVSKVSFLAGMSEHNEDIEKNREDIDNLTISVNGIIESKGVANGIATLDNSGHIPSTQLPSYVDSVAEGYVSADRTKFYEDAEQTKELLAEEGKIYLDVSTLRTYRWGGTLFAEISESLALGETAASAFPGDKGNIAYIHSQKISGNPHNVKLSDLGVNVSANVINGIGGKFDDLDKDIQSLSKEVATKANASDIAKTVYMGSSTPDPTYAKISDFGSWGTDENEKSFTMFITVRAGETVWVSVSRDDSNINAKAIRLLDELTKLEEIHYSTSENAIFVKAGAYCHNISAHIISNIDEDYVPTIAEATGLPADAKQIQITEFGAGRDVTKIGDPSRSLDLNGTENGLTYNGNAVATNTEPWIFTLEDGSKEEKEVYIK